MRRPDTGRRRVWSPMRSSDSEATIGESDGRVRGGPLFVDLFEVRAVRRGCVRGCGPAGEEVETFCGACAGFGGVGKHRQAAFGCEVEPLKVQGQLADERVDHALGAGVVEADVVRRPPSAEEASRVNPLSGLTVSCFHRLTAERCGCISLRASSAGLGKWNREASKLDGGIEGVRRSTIARRGTSSRATIAANQRRPVCQFDCDCCRGAGGVQRPGRVELADGGERPGTDHLDGDCTTDYVRARARRIVRALSVTSRGESCVVQRCSLQQRDP